MKRCLRAILVIVSVAILCGVAAPAHAQATRTWVSGVGDDVNPCSRTAPCKTFAGAISKTAVSGIIINSGSAKVVLDGLGIDGVGTGIHGINVVAASKVMVIHTTIRNFSQNGINMDSSTAGGHLFVNDSSIMNNAGGVNVEGPSNIGSLTNTSVLANTSFAVQANDATAIIGLQTSVLNDSPVGISRVPGALVISVGPSNLITGAGTTNGTVVFQ